MVSPGFSNSAITLLITSIAVAPQNVFLYLALKCLKGTFAFAYIEGNYLPSGASLHACYQRIPICYVNHNAALVVFD